MADIYNFKINERSNLEWSNLRELHYMTLRYITLHYKIKIEKIKKFIYTNAEIWELAKLRLVSEIEWTNNSKIFKFLEFFKF